MKKYNYQKIREGDSKNYPRRGDQIAVHYRGTLAADGKQFDASYDRGAPFEFLVGRGQVIKCWDEAVPRLSLGEKGVITCPSELAYGSRGAGGVIPPNADIKFEIELLTVRERRYKAVEL